MQFLSVVGSSFDKYLGTERYQQQGEGMMQTIRITGTMYEANTVPISKDEIRQLLTRLDSMEQPMDDMISLQDRLFSDSLVSGYLEDAGGVMIHIESEGESTVHEVVPDRSASVWVKPPIRGAVLVTEKVTKQAQVMLKIEGDFQPELLKWLGEKCVLPTAERKVVMLPYYDNREFDFVVSYTDTIQTYLLTQAGDVIRLQSHNSAVT